MATYTDNYNLIKPTYAETADIVPLNNNFEKIDEVMHANQTSLAPAYNQTASYQPGDVVMYELNMYKCTGATSGAWDPSKWTRTTAAETGGGGSVDFDIYGEASGTAEASFSDGAEASLVECEIGIEPTQDLHGYGKPWAGGAGKNKLDFTDTTVTSSRTIASDISLKAGSYIVAFDIKNNSNIGGYYQVRIGTTSIGGVNFGANYSGRLDKAFTLSEDSVINIFVAGASSGYSFEFSNGQIEVGSTATSFEPYSNICPISGHTDVTVTVTSTSGGSGDDTTVSLGRTVYGGTLDVTTGVLTVTHTFLTPTEVSSTGTSGGLIYYAITGLNAPSDNEADLISSHFKSERTVAVGNAYIAGYGSILVIVLDQSITTVAQANAWLVANNPQFCYKLATPQTFNLTPTQVKTLLGQNYVSHDGGGTISLVYVKGDAPIKPNPADAEIPLTGLEIDGKKFSIPSGETEIISITAGDGTTVRTFTFSKTPKFIKIYWEDTVLDGGWIADFEIVWGQPFVDYKAHARYVSYTGLAGGCASIVYPSDNKSMTLTGGNAFGACNSPNGSGLIYVQY